MFEGQGPIFSSYQNSVQPLSIRGLRRRIDAYLKIANVKRAGISGHSLRRSSASLAWDKGATLEEISAHLDHRSLDTTCRYVARLDKAKDRVSERIPIKF